MSQYYHDRNVDNVYFRELLISVLNYLTDKVYITNTVDNETTTVTVPFLYNASGDERFMQDLFLYNTMNDCIDLKAVEGNIDITPRGHLTLSDVSIDLSRLTNRYAYGYYTQIIDGQQIMFTAPIQFIPITANFSIEIIVDGRLNMFKIIEKIISLFYKGHKFNFLHRGMNIEVELGFPEDTAYESKYEFSFGDATTNKITLGLNCISHLPVIDSTQEIRIDKRIEQFNISWDVPESIPRFIGVDNYIAMDTEKIDAYKKIVSRKNAIVTDEGKKNYRDGTNSNYFEYGIDEHGGTEEVDNINVDNNIHRVDQFGIPTKTLNDEIDKY